MLLALEQDFSVSFPYVRKFNEEDLSFLSHYDAILLINPLGKMNDSYEQKEILKLIYTLEYKKLISKSIILNIFIILTCLQIKDIPSICNIYIQ